MQEGRDLIFQNGGEQFGINSRCLHFSTTEFKFQELAFKESTGNARIITSIGYTLNFVIWNLRGFV